MCAGGRPSPRWWCAPLRLRACSWSPAVTLPTRPRVQFEATTARDARSCSTSIRVCPAGLRPARPATSKGSPAQTSDCGSRRAAAAFSHARRAGRAAASSSVFARREPGRYRLRVAGAGRTAAAGVVVVRPLVLDAVGDITFGEQVGPAVSAYGGAYPWTGVARALRAADMTTGNLETSVSTRGTAGVKQYTFRGPPQALRADVPGRRLRRAHAREQPRRRLRPRGAARHAPLRSRRRDRADRRRRERAARPPAGDRRGGRPEDRVPRLLRHQPGRLSVRPRPPRARRLPTRPRSPRTSAPPAAEPTSSSASCTGVWSCSRNPTPASSNSPPPVSRRARRWCSARTRTCSGRSAGRRARTLVAWTLGNFVFPSAGVTAHTAILQVRLDARGVRGYRLLPVEIEGFRPRLLSAGVSR